jgi:hypothetical protein
VTSRKRRRWQPNSVDNLVPAGLRWRFFLHTAKASRSQSHQVIESQAEDGDGLFFASNLLFEQKQTL